MTLPAQKYLNNFTQVLDFTTGIGVTNTGHCHPKVVSAIQEQAAKIIHAQQNVFMTSEPVASLCQKMSKVYHVVCLTLNSLMGH